MTKAETHPGPGSIVRVVTHIGEKQQFKLTSTIKHTPPGVYGSQAMYHGAGYRLIQSKQTYSGTARGFAAVSYEVVK